jgi:hypothetical protein
MKTQAIYKIILTAFIASFLTGCTDLFTNPSNPSSPASKLGISISSPQSGDSISYKGALINYTVTKDAGIHAVEIYVNGNIYSWNGVNTDGSQPALSIAFDSSYIGKRISYFLIYYDTDNASVRSDTMKDILITDVSKLPYTPYDFITMPLSGSVINLSWKDSTSITSPGYEIWRKRGYFGTFVIYLTAKPGNYNINDPDAVDTTVYYYKIRALNSYGASEFSAEINTYGDGATRSIPPPAALTATAPSATKVVLSWTNDIGTVNYYKIERRYPWTTYVNVGYAIGGATQYVDSANGLTGSTGYYYRVKAIAGSDSSWSNEAFVTTPWQ